MTAVFAARPRRKGTAIIATKRGLLRGREHHSIQATSADRQLAFRERTNSPLWMADACPPPCVHKQRRRARIHDLHTSPLCSAAHSSFLCCAEEPLHCFWHFSWPRAECAQSARARGIARVVRFPVGARPPTRPRAYRRFICAIHHTVCLTLHNADSPPSPASVPRPAQPRKPASIVGPAHALFLHRAQPRFHYRAALSC